MFDEHRRGRAEERLEFTEDMAMVGGLTLGAEYKNLPPPKKNDPVQVLDPLEWYQENLRRVAMGLKPLPPRTKQKGGPKRILAEASPEEQAALLKRRALQTMASLDALDA